MRTRRTYPFYLILAVSVLSAVAVLGLLYNSYGSAVDLTKAQFSNHQALIVEQSARMVEKNVELIEIALAGLAALPSMRGPGDDRALEILSAAPDGRVLRHGRLGLMGAGGEVLAASQAGRLVEGDFPYRQCLDDMRSGTALAPTYRAVTYTGAGSGSKGLVICVPVTGPHGELARALTYTTPVEELLGGLDRATADGDTLWVLDHRGIILYPARFPAQTAAPEGAHADSAYVRFLKNIEQGRPNRCEHRLPDGTRVVASSTPIRVGGQTWSVVVETPESVIYGALSHFSDRYAVGALMVFLLAMAGMVLLGFWNMELNEVILEREKAEGALMVSETKFRALINQASDCILIMSGAEGGEPVIVDANVAACHMHGYTREELMGKPIRVLDAPDTSRLISERSERLLSGERIFFEGEHVRKDGTTFPVEVSAQVIRHEGEAYIIAIDRDITERRKAEDELWQAHQELEARVHARTRELKEANNALEAEVLERKRAQDSLLASQARLVAIHEIGCIANASLELEAVIHGILDGTLRALGATAGMVFLKDPSTGGLALGAAMGLSERFVEEYRDRQIQPGEGLTGSVYSTGKPVYIPEDSSHDPRVKRSVVAQEGLNSYIGVPIVASGEVYGVMNILSRAPEILHEREILFASAVGAHVGSAVRNAMLYSGLRESEQCISEQNAMLGNLLESLTHPFYVVDAADYTVKLANSAAGFGPLTPDSKCYALTHGRQDPCDGIGHPCTLREVLRQGRPVTVEHVHFNASGEARVYEVYGYPIRNADGRIIEVIEYALDITVRRKHEEELMKASNLESIGRLAAGVAHEINTPLTNASLVMQMLLARMSEHGPEGEIMQKLNAVDRNIDKASQIARELLQFSRQRDLEFVPFDLERVLHGALVLVEYRMKGVRVTLDLAGVGQVLGDAIKLEQVFINILINAVEAMPRGGEIAVRTYETEQDVYVCIRDSGVGVAHEHLKKVYEPFFTTKEVGEGTGLGLAICYGVIKQHRGTIELKSERGKGTVVTISLPRVHS
jgi:PAS domain S-box-containing protein